MNVELIDFFFQQIWFDLTNIQLKRLSITYSILIKLLVLSWVFEYINKYYIIYAVIDI